MHFNTQHSPQRTPRTQRARMVIHRPVIQAYAHLLAMSSLQKWRTRYAAPRRITDKERFSGISSVKNFGRQETKWASLFCR